MTVMNPLPNLSIGRPHAWTLILLLCLAKPALAVDWTDPYATGQLPSVTSAGSVNTLALPCADKAAPGPLSLAEVVDRTLCRSPKSREAWANARFQAAQVGVAHAAYLPNVSANGDAGRNWSSGGQGSAAYNQWSAAASLSYLLYDFGGRDAALENARQLFLAASATQDSVVQGHFLSAVQGYYQVQATRSAVESAMEAERASKASLDAATARHRVGVATPADKLQAQTAYSQAVLNRIRAEGDLSKARGGLANLMGMDADQAFSLQAPAESPAYEGFQANIGDLIAAARRNRPDLAAAEAQAAAARANIGVVVAAAKPSFSLTTAVGYSDRQFADASRTGSIGVNVSIPVFTGFADTYRIRASREQAAARQAGRDQINLQIALDVWNAYYGLQTETQSVASSRDLVASASRNADVALGRYKAGVGNIIDLITAQSALASARAQRIQAIFNWNVARTELAYAMGQLNDVASSSALPTTSSENRP